MKHRQLISDCYYEYKGRDPLDIALLPQSGSDRKYFRIREEKNSIIAVFNNNIDENRTFIEFSRHFKTKHLMVPEILEAYLNKGVYFQTDLGDINLYIWLNKNRDATGFGAKAMEMYKSVLDELISFQTRAVVGLDLELCYPRQYFDEQSIVWDMNYFKYMFLKLISVSFNEKKLEKDFTLLKIKLLEAGSDFFLYRDFQSANIMIQDNKPWFIDYQGGRGGAPQYDPASLLYDSKALIPQESRDYLLEYYINNFLKNSGYNESLFRELFPAFILIRVMQALGAYGYRGLYEQKPGFAQSIIPALDDISYVLSSNNIGGELPELKETILRVKDTSKYKSLLDEAERPLIK